MHSNRIIDEEYWSQFIDLDTKTLKKRHNGKRFEDLIKALLKLMYQNISWEQTQPTHDGNRDFKAIYDGETYWVECKNYATSIDLKILAATLVMAEIDDANAILFFCYSEINSNTKAKLNSFSITTNKSIYFYDGNVLDQLILKYSSQILPEFFPNLSAKRTEILLANNTVTPIILYYLERNPLINGSPTFDMDDITALQELKLGEIIGIHFIIINNDIFNNALCSISFEYKNGDNAFEILKNDAKLDGTSVVLPDIKVAAGENLHEIIYLKFRNYTPIISFPIIKYKLNKNRRKRIILPNITAYKTTQTAFLGESYISQKEQICGKCLNQNNLSVFFVYGSSGVGKTRMLYECSDKFLANGYQIINFKNAQETNLSYLFLQEIIFALYGFTDEIIDYIIQNNYDQLEQYNNDTYKEIFKLIHFFYKKRYNLLEINTIDYFPIFEKLSNDKYMLIIDDIQYLPIEFVLFLKHFFEYSKNKQRKCYTVIAIAANTDTLYNQNIIEFLSEVEDFNYSYRTNICSLEISGFENELQSYLFLKEILGVTDDIFDVEDIQRFSQNPKYLTEIANYLLDIKAIIIESGRFITADKFLIKKALQTMPTAIGKIIDKRWQLFIHQFKEDSVNYKQLICCILFLGKINLQQHETAKNYIKQLTDLCCFNFLKNEDSKKQVYIFEHDLLKSYFMEKYDDWFKIAINFIRKTTLCEDKLPINEIYNLLNANSFCIQDYPKYKKIKCSSDVKNKLNEQIIYLIARTKENSLAMLEIAEAIFQETREKFGEKRVQYMYKLFFEYYNLTSNHSLTKVYNIMLNYAENQIKLKEISNAIAIYETILKTLKSYKGKERDYIIAQIYNRWFVCGRVGGYTNQFEYKLISSLELCKKNHFCDLCIENHFDKGHSLLCEKPNLTEIIWYLDTGCQAYRIHKPVRIKGQYFYRYIQLCFLKNEYAGLWEKIISYEDIILNDNQILFKLFFRIQFLLFKIMYSLMGKRSYLEFEMENMLENLNTFQNMQNDLQLYRCYYLYGKYYTKLHKWEKAYWYYKKTLENLERNHKTQEIEFQKVVIFEDMVINFKKENFPFEQYDLSFIDHIAQSEKIKKILYLSKNKFALFLEQYESLAPIYLEETNEGYLLF